VVTLILSISGPSSLFPRNVVTAIGAVNGDGQPVQGLLDFWPRDFLLYTIYAVSTGDFNFGL
jgi:hypothetical protein